MDVNGSAWNDEQISGKDVVGVYVEGPDCLVLLWLQTISMVLAFIITISNVYVSNSKLNIYPVLLISV